MLYRHLSMAYRDGGLSALVRQGADCTTIWSILEDSYEDKGITREEANTAKSAAMAAEKTKFGRIAIINHEKFQPALDYFLFNMKSNLVITPTRAFVRGTEETIAKLGYKFEITEKFDEIWQVNGDSKEIVQEFRKITK